MIRSFIIKNSSGQELELIGNSLYDLINIDGLNPPGVTINKSEIVNLDGSRINSTRLNDRNIVITLNIRPPIEQNRILLYTYFRGKSNCEIKITTETRSVRIAGTVETFENNHFGNIQQPQISIICPKPYFLDEEEVATEFTTLVPLFEFPFSIPAEGIEFSRRETTVHKIINAGDVEIGAKITFTASDTVMYPTVLNLTTNEFLKVAANMWKGDVLTINTNKGEKSIKVKRALDGTTLNLLANRMSGSTWLQLVPGDNDISFSADTGSDYLTMSLSISKKYEGI